MSTAENTVCNNYAILETGGKQYQAVVGQTLAVEKLEGEPGDKVSFDKVLLVKHDAERCDVGQPFVDKATVQASIVKQAKGPKLVVFKFQRRKRVRVKKGHRQPQTVVRFEAIKTSN